MIGCGIDIGWQKYV